jgi:hypothetical protein
MSSLIEPAGGAGEAAFVATGRVIVDATLVAAPGDPVTLEQAVRWGLLDEDQAEAVPATGVTAGSAGDVTTAVTPDLSTATVAEVLAAVGDDPHRAAAALKVERANRRRTTLIASLEAIASKTEA